MAEIRIAAQAGAWLTGLPQTLLSGLLVAIAAAIVACGGMRALTWTTAAQAVVVLLAIVGVGTGFIVVVAMDADDLPTISAVRLYV